MADQGVTYTLTGHITNAAAQPVPGVTVRASVRHPGAADQVVGEVSTDGAGSFRIDFQLGPQQPGVDPAKDVSVVSVEVLAGGKPIGRSAEQPLTEAALVFDVTVDYDVTARSATSTANWSPPAPCRRSIAI